MLQKSGCIEHGFLQIAETARKLDPAESGYAERPGYDETIKRYIFQVGNLIDNHTGS